jgi:phage shock protein PspC (stress-responsive transcriptional regulator)
MQSEKGNLITRDDTMLGVCQGLGEDFGINPFWLRSGLALLLFWNPAAAVAAYLGAGALVAVLRLVFPNPAPAQAPAAQAAGPAPAEQAVEPEPVALAA